MVCLRLYMFVLAHPYCSDARVIEADSDGNYVFVDVRAYTGCTKDPKSRRIARKHLYPETPH